MKVFRIVYRGSDGRRTTQYVQALQLAVGYMANSAQLPAGKLAKITLESVEVLDMPDGKQEEGKL